MVHYLLSLNAGIAQENLNYFLRSMTHSLQKKYKIPDE